MSGPYGPFNPHPYDDPYQNQGNPDWPGSTYPMADGYYDPTEFEQYGARGAQEYWAARQQAMGYILSEEERRYYESGGGVAVDDDDYENDASPDESEHGFGPDDDGSVLGPEAQTALEASTDGLLQKIRGVVAQDNSGTPYSRQFAAHGSFCRIHAKRDPDGGYIAFGSRSSVEHGHYTFLWARCTPDMGHWYLSFSVRPFDVDDDSDDDDTFISKSEVFIDRRDSDVRLRGTFDQRGKSQDALAEQASQYMSALAEDIT